MKRYELDPDAVAALDRAISNLNFSVQVVLTDDSRDLTNPEEVTRLLSDLSCLADSCDTAIRTLACHASSSLSTRASAAFIAGPGHPDFQGLLDALQSFAEGGLPDGFRQIAVVEDGIVALECTHPLCSKGGEVTDL